MNFSFFLMATQMRKRKIVFLKRFFRVWDFYGRDNYFAFCVVFLFLCQLSLCRCFAIFFRHISSISFHQFRYSTFCFSSVVPNNSRNSESLMQEWTSYNLYLYVEEVFSLVFESFISKFCFVAAFLLVKWIKKIFFFWKAMRITSIDKNKKKATKFDVPLIIKWQIIACKVFRTTI